jgi:hypothetical protein
MIDLHLTMYEVSNVPPSVAWPTPTAGSERLPFKQGMLLYWAYKLHVFVSFVVTILGVQKVDMAQMITKPLQRTCVYV